MNLVDLLYFFSEDTLMPDGREKGPQFESSRGLFSVIRIFFSVFRSLLQPTFLLQRETQNDRILVRYRLKKKLSLYFTERAYVPNLATRFNSFLDSVYRA